MPELKFKALFFLASALILSGCQAVGSNKPAALQVTSTPEGSVFLDGRHIGKTPFFSDQLKNGVYTFKISSSDATYVDKINLTEGTLTVINRELSSNFQAQAGEILRLEEGKGIFVSSMPKDADLTVDGKFAGKTPKLILNVKEGDHKLLVSKDGYQKREFVVKTSPGHRLISEVTLASEIAKGTNSLQAQPPATTKVEVLRTPQGFLRVRQEASLDSLEVGRVKTGDRLEVIQETKDWVKVKFEGKFGWISSQFVKKI